MNFTRALCWSSIAKDAVEQIISIGVLVQVYETSSRFDEWNDAFLNFSCCPSDQFPKDMWPQ